MLKEEIAKRAEIINKAIEELLPEKEPVGLYKADKTSDKSRWQKA